jgi:hypothetical protein
VLILNNPADSKLYPPDYGASHFWKVLVWMFDGSNIYDFKYLVHPLLPTELTSSVMKIFQQMERVRPARATSLDFTKFATQQPTMGLAALPTELLENITMRLPLPCIFALRCCSKQLAYKIPLTQHFWRTHLFSGSVVPYLWDLDATQSRNAGVLGDTIDGLEVETDWRNVAALLINSDAFIDAREEHLDREKRLWNISMGLWNRCRIWSIVDRMAAEKFK